MIEKMKRGYAAEEAVSTELGPAQEAYLFFTDRIERDRSVRGSCFVRLANITITVTLHPRA
jgi:hypothetical protein